MSEKDTMTVKELKEKLEEFPDNLIVMIPNMYWSDWALNDVPEYVSPTSVVEGGNEADGLLYID